MEYSDEQLNDAEQWHMKPKRKEGRPFIGRKLHAIRVTDSEYQAIRELLAKLRGKDSSSDGR